MKSCVASNEQLVTDVSGERFPPTFKDQDVQENYFGHKFFLYIWSLKMGPIQSRNNGNKILNDTGQHPRGTKISVRTYC